MGKVCQLLWGMTKRHAESLKFLGARPKARAKALPTSYKLKPKYKLGNGTPILDIPIQYFDPTVDVLQNPITKSDHEI